MVKNTVYETIVFIRISLIKVLLLVGFRPFDPKPFILQPLGRQSLKDVWWCRHLAVQAFG
jgi:hypothetical protein